MNRSLLLSLLTLSLLFVTGCDAEVEGDEAGECDDGVDNDQDGTLDCDDDGCAIAAVCAGDDDDAAGDDDDTAGDDDDTSDDDDVADDDDSAGDDDDSAGDDDDSTVGDDDDSTPSVAPENFRVELFWTIGGDNLDLHLLEANDGSGVAGSPRTDGDCYYANCSNPSASLDWGVPGDVSDDPGLDLNDTFGVGPENINITNPASSPYDGDYIVFVHDNTWTEPYEAPNDTTVNIYLDGVLAQTFNFQLVGEDDDHYVARIHWPTGAITPCSGVATSPSAGCP